MHQDRGAPAGQRTDVILITSRVDHTAIGVADLNEAIPRWLGLSGGHLLMRKTVPEQAVEIAMLKIGDSQLELIQPLDEVSGVARFLAKRGESLHHIGLAVDDIGEALDELNRQGMELIDREPRAGAHGLIGFIHPRSTGGVLIELVEKG